LNLASVSKQASRRKTKKLKALKQKKKPTTTSDAAWGPARGCKFQEKSKTAHNQTLKLHKKEKAINLCKKYSHSKKGKWHKWKK